MGGLLRSVYWLLFAVCGVLLVVVLCVVSVVCCLMFVCVNV